MKAIELTATIDEKGQLNLDQCLEVTQPQRVRVIVLMSDVDNTTTKDIIQSDNLAERIKNRFNGQDTMITPHEQPKRPLKRGSAKGKVWMSDDFDQPLEDVEKHTE